MEVLLRSEIFYKSPEFHNKVRTYLKHCTNCILSQCSADEFDPCVNFCMKPCTDFKINYELKRQSLLTDMKTEFITLCTQKSETSQCESQLIDKYNQLLTSLFESL